MIVVEGLGDVAFLYAVPLALSLVVVEHLSPLFGLLSHPCNFVFLAYSTQLLRDNNPSPSLSIYLIQIDAMSSWSWIYIYPVVSTSIGVLLYLP